MTPVTDHRAACAEIEVFRGVQVSGGMLYALTCLNGLVSCFDRPRLSDLHAAGLIDAVIKVSGAEALSSGMESDDDTD